MPQSIPDDSQAPEESCNKIKKDCNSKRWYINHSKKISRKARDAAGHVDEVIVGSALLAFFEEPGFGAFEDFVAYAPKENVHSHAQNPENKHVERGFRIDKVQNTCNSLECEKRKH